MRADRGRALLVLLLALLVMAGATAPAAAQGDAGLSPVAAPGTPATHHDLRDWLPLAGRHTLATPLPDSWCAVCAHTPAASAPPGRPLAGDAAGTAVATDLAATPSTRAPPVRVS